MLVKINVNNWSVHALSLMPPKHGTLLNAKYANSGITELRNKSGRVGGRC